MIEPRHCGSGMLLSTKKYHELRGTGTAKNGTVVRGSTVVPPSTIGMWHRSIIF